MDDAIPLDEIRGRQEAVRRRFARLGLDALVVIGRSFYDRVGDLAYLSNHFPPFPATVFAERQRGLGHGVLVLPASGPSTLLLDGWACRREMVVADEVEASPDLPALLATVLQRRGLGTARLGLVGDDILPVAMARAVADALPALEIQPADHLVREMRRIKSPAELQLLRRAAAVAEVGLAAAVRVLHATAPEPPSPAAEPSSPLTERAVCAEGIAAAMQAGADFVRYLRVHSGPDSALASRWPQATARPIAAGELVTLDIIGAYRGYQFDVLRTTVAAPAPRPAAGLDPTDRAGPRTSTGATPTPEQRRLLEAVLEAVRRAVDACRPGKRCCDVVRAANGYLEEQGYGAYVRAFMGHGIGLETVEEPYLTPGDPTLLAPGMVLCVEPGVYVPGWGGASIEQEVAVTDGGPPELLTQFPDRLWPGA